MRNVIILYKPLGWTPLQTIEKFRKDNPEYAKVKLGYAGRLDPMAEGVLLVLAGEENKKRKTYEALKKEYEFEVLFGVTTDTYDTLGLISSVKTCTINKINPNISKEKNISNVKKQISKLYLKTKIKQLIPKIVGKRLQSYPPYSSKPVNCKPLYWWARRNRLHEIVIPEKEIEIYDFTLLSLYSFTKDELETIVLEKLAKVSGDFRQEEIKKCWREFFGNYSPIVIPVFTLEGKTGIYINNSGSLIKSGMTNALNFQVARFTISCSSGTYVRSIAHGMGEKLGCGAIALSIKRTKVGKYSIQQVRNTS